MIRGFRRLGGLWRPLVFLAVLVVLGSGIVDQTARLVLISGDFGNPLTADRRVVEHPNLAGAGVFSYMRGPGGEGTRTLVFRQTDFAFHTGRPYISDLDPRLIPLYEEGRDGDAGTHLARLGVTHVEVPGYLPSTFYNSGVAALVADPTRSRLVAADGGYRLYELVDQDDVECTPVPLGTASWSVWDGSVLADRLEVGEAPIQQDDPLTLIAAGDSALELVTGDGAPTLPAPQAGLLGYDLSSRDLVLRGRIAGEGLLQVEVRTYDNRGRVFETPVWDGVLTRQPTTMAMQFRMPDRRGPGRLVLQTVGPAPRTTTFDALELCVVGELPDRLQPAGTPPVFVGDPDREVVVATRGFLGWHELDAASSYATVVQRNGGGLPEFLAVNDLQLTFADRADRRIGLLEGRFAKRLDQLADGRWGLVPGIAQLIVAAQPAFAGAANHEVVIQATGDGGAVVYVLWHLDGQDGFSLAGQTGLPQGRDDLLRLPVAIPPGATVDGVVLEASGLRDSLRLSLGGLDVRPLDPE